MYVFDVDAYRRQWKQLKSECFKSLLPKDLEVDGINYQLFFSNGCKVRVIKKNSGYTDAISIPEQVTYKGVTFTVTDDKGEEYSASNVLNYGAFAPTGTVHNPYFIRFGESDLRKVMENGILYIHRNGNTYNAQGTKL